MRRFKFARLWAFLLATCVAAASRGQTLNLEDQVVEHTLDNGLKLLIVPRHDVPRVVCHIYYKVGSVYERPGITGISHFLEHMMFKGTRMMGVTDAAADAALDEKLDALMNALYAEKFRTRSPDLQKIAAWSAEADKLMAEQKQYVIKDDLWEMYMRNGGTGLNASTGQETTGYYVTLPSNKVELQMLMEADRMQNAVFREFYSEKEVVREERRLSENQPGYFFQEQLNAAFYAASPYAWSVIGWDVDLQKVTRQDMIDYKSTYYVPNNAVAVYVGDVRAEEVIRLAEQRFGPIPRGRDLEPVRTTEPKQYCEKRILGEAETAPSLSIMYHIPPEGHPDDQVFRVLSGILSGTTGRLHKKLVNELDIALNARAFANSMTYAGAFLFMATPNEPGGHTPSELEEAICAEIERLKKEPVTDYELQKVKNQAEAGFVRQLRSNMGLAFQLGRSELGLGWREISRSLERMREVSAEDVQRVANETFTHDNRTVGVLLRKKSEGTRRPGPPRNTAKES